MAEKKRGLGRGVEALGLHELIAGINTSVNIADRTPLEADREGLLYVSITRLVPGVYQPRSCSNDEQLLELAQSIRSHGVIQPILVRAAGITEYEIIAGERRWRAAKLANLQLIPVLVRSMTDEEAAAVALIENIQREALNVVDEATAFQRLIGQFGLTHQSLAKMVGKSRASISNTLRILEADSVVRDALVAETLTMGHARALLSLSKTDQARVTQQVLRGDLSVRATERLVKRTSKPAEKTSPVPSAYDVKALERVSAWLKTSIQVHTQSSGAGQLRIGFENQSQLDQLLQQLLSAASVETLSEH
jgi:ParB family transcriptional regulator, chromosome partitioning protein